MREAFRRRVAAAALMATALATAPGAAADRDGRLVDAVRLTF